MTPSDLLQFSDKIQRLAKVFNHDLNAETIQDYFEDLKEFSWPTVDRALGYARKGSKYWPKPAHLREYCLFSPHVASDVEIPSWVDHNAEIYFCKDCSDTGFIPKHCDGTGRCGIGHCGKQYSDGHTHDYVSKCHCRATNPILCAERAEFRKRSQPSNDFGRS